MDDTAQKQKLVSDNAQVQTQPQVQPQPSVTPTGTANKEVEATPVSDYIRSSEPEMIRDKEVVEAGILEAEREIKLEEVHEKMGVKLSAESTPVKTEPTGLVHLPMDEKEASRSAKKGPGHNFDLGKFFEGIFFTDSVYGFAILMLKHLKRIHRKIIGQPV